MAVATVKRSEQFVRNVVTFAMTPRWEWRAAMIVAGGVLLRLGLVKLGALVSTVGALRPRHVHAWLRMRTRYNALQHQKKRPTVNLVRTVLPEVAVTDLQRERKWWARLCEVRHITPAPRVTKVDPVKGGRKLTLELNKAGMTVEAFRKYESQVLLYLGAAAFDVRIADHPNDKSQCFLYVMTVDLLKSPLGPWPLLGDAPGSHSIAEGILVGQDTTTDEIRLDVTTDAVFISGQRGMGKSGCLHQIAAGAALCHDVDEWIFDMREGSEFYMYQGHVARFIDSPEAALAAARELRRLRKERSAYLRDRGFRKWEPGCGLKFILLIIDEVAECDDGTPGETQVILTQIVRLGRAAGIGAVFATQRPSADYIDTSLRAQFSVAISYRVRPGDEQISLGPGAKALRLFPHLLPRWRFIMLGSDALDGDQGRGWYLTNKQIESLVAKLPTIWPPPSALTSESDTDRTPGDLRIEPPTEIKRTMSDPPAPAPAIEPDPPAEAARNERARALWDGLPGTPSELMERSGYGRSQQHKILTEWVNRGLVLKVGDAYEKRDPATIERLVAS